MEATEMLEYIREIVENTLITHLGIEFTEVGEDYIEATMPVDGRTHTPSQVLHGGAMMALAESVGSALSYLFIDLDKQDARGLEINGNHLKGVTSGMVKARATIVHKGRRTHVADIRITDEEGRLLNVSRMTNMIIDR